MNKGFLVLLAGLMAACGADSNSDPKSSDAVNGDKAKAAFEEAFDGMKVTEVRAAPVDGIVELDVNGRESVYVTEDGRHIFIGKLLEIKDGEVVNPAEQRFEKVRKEGIKKLDPADMITYTAEEEKAEVYVFTDISCGFCRKLHRHIDEYNAAGVTVHYLAFPRGGPTSEAAGAMRHIWCAEDRGQALTDAKLNNEVIQTELTECAKPVDEQYQLGNTFGVRGTPAIYSTEGEQLGGYVTPEQLLERLE